MSMQGKSQIKKKPLSREQRARILNYLERHRGQQQYRHAPSAAWSTNKILRPLTKKFGPGKSALQSHWPQIIGEKWAQLSRPLSIRTSKEGKTLIIEAKGPASALIQANSGQLLGKINQFMGANAITKIKVVQGRIKMPHTKTEDIKPQQVDQLHSLLEDTTENRLKRALSLLGTKIHNRTQ